MKNIAYAGALVAALDIDMQIVEKLLDEKFAGKKALRESNRQRCSSATTTRRNISRARCRSIWKRWTRTTTRS